MWVVLGYPEAEACMRDPRLHRQEHLDKLIRSFGSDRINQRQKLDIPYMDGEPHAQARQHVLAAFHAIDLPRLRQRCDQLLEEMLLEIPRDAWLDLMPALAYPLPLLINSALMGVPSQQQRQVLQEVSPFVRARGLNQTEATARGGGDQALEFHRRFFLPWIEERRLNPQ
jgi:cytochrome P450